MKKLLTFILSLLIVSPCYAAIQWRAGTGEAVLDGTSAANLIGYNSYNKVVQPLDNLLSTYCTESLSYNSVSIITVKAGSCVVSNSQGSIRMFMLDPTDTTLSATNLDAGSSFSAGTTYYVYATSPNATTQTSTYYISLSNTAPTGQTYYKRIGSFTTNSSSNIGLIHNDGKMSFGAASSKTVGTTYQALSDGIVVASADCSGVSASINDIFGYSDSSSSPTTLYTSASCQYNNTNDVAGLSFPVKAGDYYKVTVGSRAGQPTASNAMYFIPIN